MKCLTVRLLLPEKRLRASSGKPTRLIEHLLYPPYYSYTPTPNADSQVSVENIQTHRHTHFNLVTSAMTACPLTTVGATRSKYLVWGVYAECSCSTSMQRTPNIQYNVNPLNLFRPTSPPGQSQLQRTLPACPKPPS